MNESSSKNFNTLVLGGSRLLSHCVKKNKNKNLTYLLIHIQLISVTFIVVQHYSATT